jgi:putative ABC transport system substrate-binding protein
VQRQGPSVVAGPDRVQYRRAASFVDKIFKGAKPADLPVEQPTKFELIINMKTAVLRSLALPTETADRAPPWALRG